MMSYTPLDSLKQCAAQADRTLKDIIEIVSELPNLSSPMVIQDCSELACHQLSELRALISDSLASHADDDGAQTYSDGRPVMSVVPYGESGLFTRVWDADPAAPGNQPGILPIPPVLADGVGYQFVVVAPGFIVAVEKPEH
jgi:hypothetical protein